MEKMIHTTIGVYNSCVIHEKPIRGRDFKVNGVPPENLKDHIEYNKTWRFGRALFLDGKCIYKGYLKQESCDKFEQFIADNPQLIQTKDTQPYH